VEGKDTASYVFEVQVVVLSPPALGGCSNCGYEFEPFYLADPSNPRGCVNFRPIFGTKSTFGISVPEHNLSHLQGLVASQLTDLSWLHLAETRLEMSDG